MDVKIEELKRVQAQVQYMNAYLLDPLEAGKLTDWNKIRIAEAIGVEMLKNGLIDIQVSESEDGSFTILKGRATVYKKSEE